MNNIVTLLAVSPEHENYIDEYYDPLLSPLQMVRFFIDIKL